MSAEHSLYVVNRQPGILIEELPSCQNRQQCEDIFVLKPLQLIRATPQKDQVRKRLAGDKRFENNGRRTGVESCRILVDQTWHKLSVCEDQFLCKRMRQMHSPALALIIDPPPFPLLQFLRLLALCPYSPLGSRLLVVCATQRNRHSDQRNDCRSSAAQFGESGPIEIAGRALLDERSQALKFAQLPFPLWTRRHSAAAGSTWPTHCGSFGNV
ncbi:hypothetical protein [Stenotrophomonas maltophilia]|uniref:hypothetical protein n=1 Tax=Stenotrophomonas maltophilia TaxID=40324 RepID=UPI0012B03CDB|nr:hypothetical protein [Stenotrophomonas maltophilia]QGM06083.1 hypothetical protein FEO88_14930 [Stenotrophomonas maltophilia]